MPPSKSKKRKAPNQGHWTLHDLNKINEFEYSSESDQEPPKIPAKKRKKKQQSKKKDGQSKGKQKSRRRNVQDDDAEVDELAAPQYLICGSSIRARKTQNIMKDLDTAIAYLSNMGDAEDIESWLRSHGFEDDADVNALEEKCGTIFNLLRARHEKTKSNKSPNHGFGDFEDFLFFRDGRTRIKVLAPVEIFQADHEIRNKTLAFIRQEGNYWPIKWSLSGKKTRVFGHSKMLDNEFWSQETLRFGEHIYHKFRASGWESGRGDAMGTDFAGHAEKMLMLERAYDTLVKFTGEHHDYDYDILVKRLHQLRKMKPRITFEIGQDRWPCGCCQKFQDHLQTITGLRFKFIIVPNLGILKHEQDRRGRYVLPLYSQDTLQL
jgi:hypothetical protein